MNADHVDRLAGLSPGDISAVIQMAWEDRTTFETIHERIGLSEPDVIRLMRSELNFYAVAHANERPRHQAPRSAKSGHEIR
jgi:uncharacterized protein (TIGR03643 family)